MLTIIGNLAVVFLPIIIYIPQLFKRKSRIPLTVSLFTILASLFQLCFTFLYCRLERTISLTLIFKNILCIILHFYLINYKTPIISSLEEKIYYNNKKLFKFGVKTTFRSLFTVITCLLTILAFYGNNFISLTIGYFAMAFDALTLISQILIYKLNKRTNNLPIKAFEEDKFETNIYKITATGHFLKALWYLNTHIPLLLVFNECSLMILSAYIGFAF